MEQIKIGQLSDLGSPAIKVHVIMWGPCDSLSSNMYLVVEPAKTEYQ